MKYLTLVLILVASSAHADKNRLSVLGGYGAQKGFTGTSIGLNNRLDTSRSFKTGFVHGVQYQRGIGERLSVGVQGQTNDTISLLFGVDF